MFQGQKGRGLLNKAVSWKEASNSIKYVDSIFLGKRDMFLKSFKIY